MSAPPSSLPATGTSGELAQACGALWLATLGLMTAFMHATGPAHRVLLAGRVSRNLQTLADQDVFPETDRQKFARLAKRWHARAEESRDILEGRRTNWVTRMLRPLLGGP